jgi:uncharacterized protein YbaR (Trm112 family)
LRLFRDFILFEDAGAPMAVSEELLAILACPVCKGKIHPDDSGSFLNCDACRLQYPVENDIPVMLVDKASKMD